MKHEDGKLAPAARPMPPAGSAPRALDVAALVLGLAALVLWASQAWRERFLCDDAFISFRYAEHLSSGMGLVWNAGERVEGYTNFSWVLLMAAGMRVGLTPELFSQVLGCASALALLVSIFLAGGPGSVGRVKGALMALLLGAHGSFGAWSTSGLETMFFTLLVWLATWRFLAEGRDAERSRLGSALLFALASLTRPEGALFAGLAGLFLLVRTMRGRSSARALVTFALAYAVPVAAHLAWRVGYYGDWLPNTFRAKVAGAWLEQGLAYLKLYGRRYFALALVPGILLGFPRRRRAEAALLAAMLVAYLAYVVAVGGDRFEFRFLVVVLPHFTWLAVESAVEVVEHARALWSRRVLTALVAFVLLCYLASAIGRSGWKGGAVDGIAPVAGVRAYAERRIDEGRFLRRWIEAGVLPRELVLCVGGAGAVPYYTRWTTVDRRGLNDATIARLPMTERGTIAHERDAPYEYLVQRRVAVFDFVNRLVWTPEVFEGARGNRQHDGHPLVLRAIRLGEGEDEAYFAFATFVSDAELAALFPGLEIVTGESTAQDAPGD